MRRGREVSPRGVKPPSWRCMALPTEPTATEPVEVSGSESRLKGFSVVGNMTAGEASKFQRPFEAVEESCDLWWWPLLTVLLLFKRVWLNSVIMKVGNAPGSGREWGGGLFNPTHTRKYSKNSVSVSKNSTVMTFLRTRKVLSHYLSSFSSSHPLRSSPYAQPAHSAPKTSSLH